MKGKLTAMDQHRGSMSLNPIIQFPRKYLNDPTIIVSRIAASDLWQL